MVVVVGATVVVVVVVVCLEVTAVNLSNCLEICHNKLLFVLHPICLFGIAIIYAMLNIVKLTDGDNGLLGLVPAAVGKSFIPVACDHQ